MTDRSRRFTDKRVSVTEDDDFDPVEQEQKMTKEKAPSRWQQLAEPAERDVVTTEVREAYRMCEIDSTDVRTRSIRALVALKNRAFGRAWH